MMFKISAVAAALAISSSALAAEPTNQQLLDLIKLQEAKIQQLKQAVEQNQQLVKQTEQKAEASAQAIEQNLSNAAQSNTHLGGYGELHYNNIEDEKTLDLHRFVLFVGHEFNDTTRLFSELEVEHSFIEGGEGGEVAMEQAYIEHDLSESSSVKLGMFLVPVGLINETHEPPAFYGVERNPVEHDIIPATWSEGGADFVFKPHTGITIDLAVTAGLNVPVSGDEAYEVREGRQSVSEANADSLAYTGRIKYTAIPGLELASTVQYQSDITQGIESVSATLFEAHAVYQVNQFMLKALYATWDIDSNNAKAIGRDEQTGYYIEPSYRVNENLGFFARYSAWDNNAGDAADSEKTQSNIGFNYWLQENVVLKFDLESQGGVQDGEGFNMGVGYQF